LHALFLREYNRIAGVLAADKPDWDDERLFETSRMVMIVLLLKLVVEEYLRHIGPFECTPWCRRLSATVRVLPPLVTS
jgi:prostaglandin-endoperoxide synthase 2